MANANINDWQAVDDDWEEIPAGTDTKFDQRAFDKASPLGNFSNPMQKIMDYIAKSPVGSLKEGVEQGVTLGFKDKLIGQNPQPSEHPVANMLGYGIGTGMAQAVPFAGIRAGQTIRNIPRAMGQGYAQGVAEDENPNRNALLAGGLQTAFGVLGGAGKKFADTDKLQEMANNRAIKSTTGQNVAALRKLAGIKAEGGNLERIKNNYSKHGKNIFEEKVIQPFDKSQDIAPRLNQAAQKYGSNIGEVGQAIDQAMPNSIDTMKIAEEILKFADGIPKSVKNKNLIDGLRAEAAELAKTGKMGFVDANKFKSDFKFEPTSQNAVVSSQKGINAINRIFGKSLKESAKEADKIIPGIDAKYLDSLKRYGTFKHLGDVGGERYVRDISNRLASPTDYYAAGTGMNTAGAVGALGAIGNKLGRERLSSAAALAGNTVAAWSRALQESPEFAHKFGNIVIESLRRGPAAITTTHYMLMKNPEYQAAMAGEEENGDEE